MSKVYDRYQEQQKLNSPTIDPTEEDMEPTDDELTELEWEMNNLLD